MNWSPSLASGSFPPSSPSSLAFGVSYWYWTCPDHVVLHSFVPRVYLLTRTHWHTLTNKQTNKQTKIMQVWFVFSSVTGFFLVKCTFEKAIDKALPKLIYRWFFTVFKTSVAVGSIGYVLILINIFLFAGMAPPIADVTGIALLALWYGLYFGILTRDCAEVASDRIASRLGGARRMAVSVRDCAICGGDLSPDPNLFTSNGTRTSHTHSSAVVEVEKEKEKEDATVQLSCKHLFHKDCLRGWLIVGKKDTCPTCHERVDLRQLYADKPWETSNLQWVQMLDFFRYLVVWQPTILIALNFVFHWLHLDDDGGSDEGIVEVFANTGGGLVMGGNSSVGGNATVGGGLGAVA